MDILLIDDDEELCDEIRDVLRDEGYTVDVAHDGSHGLRRMAEKRYDLLLLDLKIPGATGFEVLEALSTKPYKPRIIVVSGHPVRSELVRQISGPLPHSERWLLEADAFLNKPYDIPSLLDKITHVMSSS